VCLTSRRPKIDQRWLESFHGTKATVKVFPMDVTDKDSLDSVVKTIRATCPRSPVSLTELWSSVTHYLQNVFRRDAKKSSDQDRRFIQSEPSLP
jgi:enoyl-[acyl-carrier-protein] reductase (NADH)